jgi:hypothetical protein
MDIGIAFEHYILELYKKKKQLRHNITFKTEENIRIQIDLTYNYLFYTKFIECKYKEKAKVGLEEVAKFSAQLELLEIPTKYGEIITNSYYTKRAIIYADKKRIKLYDISDLEKITNQESNKINKDILTLYKQIIKM